MKEEGKLLKLVYKLFDFLIFFFSFLQPEENEQTLKFRQNDLKPLLPIQNLHNVKFLRESPFKNFQFLRFLI